MTDKVLGIIGHPVSHSLSPAMHNHAARILGLGYSYVAFDVGPGSPKPALDAMRALGIVGVNVTVPHKEAAARLVDKLEGDAARVGAVNTITNVNGALVGSNTDGIGFVRALKREKIDPAGKKTVVVGAGGSSRSICLALLREGAFLTIVNRTPEAGRNLARILSPFGKASFSPSSSRQAAEAAAGADIIVQTTPLGMRKSDPLPLADPRFHKGQVVYDIIYSPERTKLLKLADKHGARTINGLSMLVFQGSESFKIWTGRRFPEEKALSFLKRKLKGG
ncbi:MAG: shikimate dehydrogenase [Nitrospinae bacterium]|nr:shikimate dehydrogenase [Nitrospinota bacterium]